MFLCLNAEEIMPERPQDLSRFREDAFTSHVLGENPTMSRPQIIVSPRKLEPAEVSTEEHVSNNLSLLLQ